MVHFPKIITILSILFFLSACSLNHSIKQADKRYEIGEYHAAASRYKRILSRIPSKDKKLQGAIAFKLGNCYRLIHDPRRAEGAYRKAVRFRHPDSMLYLYYGDVLLRNGRPKEAKSAFYRVLRKDSSNQQAQNAILACDSLSIWKKVPQRYALHKATYINGRKSDDFSPCVSDADLIYFSSTRTTKGAKKIKNSKITGIPNSSIYFVKRNRKGKWDAPTLLGDAVNATASTIKGIKQLQGDVGVCTLSPDGKSLFFTAAAYAQGSSQGARIYQSNRQAGEWAEAKEVILVKDSSVTIAHPVLSNDGHLYFTSDMPGGYGGKDLYRCVRKSEGQWGKIENLGPDINTSGDEMFPTFASNGTLYFSSDGHPSMGGLDLYAAHFIGYDTINHHPTFSIRHLDVPFNSNGDDFSLSLVPNANEGYLSSNRNDPKGLDQIYHFAEPDVSFSLSGIVQDYREQPLPDAIIRVVGDDGTNRRINVKRDGSYSFPLSKNVNYVILAACRGHLNSAADFSTVGVFKNQNYTQDFTLPSMLQPVPIDNIFFDFAKYTLRPESQQSLDALVKMLNDNPHITIRIEAHTDMIGSEESNNLLSERRAEAVVKYLESKGIESERLDFRGYGEQLPVTVSEQQALRYPFLKEGQLLNQDFVLSLPDKQQEVANQINRRTEFVVTRTTYKMY